MKTLDDFYDDIADSDEYEVTLTLTDFIDADELETSLKAMLIADELDDKHVFESTSRGFIAMLKSAINERANKALQDEKDKPDLTPSWANEFDARRHA